MNLLRSLTRSQIMTMLFITTIVVTSLLVWQKYDNHLEEDLQQSEYNILLEENQALRYEIKNLEKQNQLLYKVLGLKKDLE